jgi:ATP dependent DNA ligase domain
MLSRPGPLPSGSGWSFELKWDGFRAIVSTEDGLAVRSRRGWDMTSVLPELRDLPAGLVLDGELVAWRGSEPYFPLICRRVLNCDASVPMTFVVFDLLRRDGVDFTSRPYDERRGELASLGLDGPAWRRWIRRRRREREPDLRRLRRRLQTRAVERGNTTRAGTEEESIAVSSPPCASCPQCRSVSPPRL